MKMTISSNISIIFCLFGYRGETLKTFKAMLTGLQATEMQETNSGFP